jgi:flavin-dependent dehydrogenase
VIVGAGPAGAVAGIVLARAGVRVRLLDRATFPRDKLCGDTINPGTLAALRRLGVATEIERRALRVGGMILTGERRVTIEGRYPRGLQGCAIVRRDLDALLLEAAVAAGCEFESGVVVQRAVVDASRDGPSVTGVVVGGNGASCTTPARIVIAADGRRSAVAFALRAARHPARPRRWAVGGYFENFAPNRPGRDQVTTGRRPGHDQVTPGGSGAVLGEMHVRRNCYIGVADVPGGLTNVCLVKPSRPADPDLRDPRALLLRELAADSMLRGRAADARLAAPPVVLGPLAVDVDPPALEGLLLAGDAAGFIDPMTGDGLHFAVRGGELAAQAALHALEHGWTGVHARLAGERRRAFAGKWRFNRLLRALVASPRAIDAATIAGRLAPRAFESIVARAGDCHRAG